MMHLKQNKMIFFISLILFGCVSSSYKVVPTSKNKKEVFVTPDRVMLECSNVGADDGTFYGFSIHVLDEENTVLEIIQTNKLDKEGCASRLKKIGRILQQGQYIRIYGIGSDDLEQPRKKENHSKFFKGHGTYYTNGRVQQFMYIMNEHGGCYDAYSADQKPCPQD